MKQVIALDLGGVLLKEAELNLEKGILNEFNIHIKNPPRIFNRIFEFVKIVAEKDHKRDWIIGKVKATELIEIIKNNIDSSEFSYLFKNKDEKDLIKFGSEIILDPNKLVNYTHLYDEGMNFVQKCKANNIKLMVLSNWDPYSFDILKVKFTELFNLFSENDILIPNKIGYVKPEIEIYKHLIQKAGDSNNIFFVDDSLINVENAKKLNIKGVFHINWQETENQLKQTGLFI